MTYLNEDTLVQQTTVDYYTQSDVDKNTEAVFYHVYRAYPTVPSLYYATVGN